ncbi:helix-turn-helix transcriptional regulator [Pseudorhodobacter sp. MZDSW-24AT]|uniref:helix-turn-helix transcriptional regulator n=1 Tax=Pseudorhodobacter sp. MZDSW-24AT TaxID=2052957 RepID=UPI0021013BBF|nr:helix-turn-helix transcriptional regulator [Pseudorhodobacter sp. MZDSW-24AT]
MPSIPLIAQIRRSRGMTQGDLAEEIGISIPTVRALERGQGNLQTMRRCMRVLGLDWGWAQQDQDPAALLAAIRRTRGLSQAFLAERAGCSRPSIIALEKDLSGSVSILSAVLTVLGVRELLRKQVDVRVRGLVPAKNAPARDLVMTPAPQAGAIITHFSEQLYGSILDPARGQGAFFDQFPANLSHHWCELAEGLDFLEWKRPVDWIITNPPWSRLREFTRHAMTVADNIVWLAPIVNMTTKARLRDLDQFGFGIAELLLIDTPKSWPQSGFQLAAVHLRKGHPSAWQVSRLGAVTE